jgi:hypothetical protein
MNFNLCKGFVQYLQTYFIIAGAVGRRRPIQVRTQADRMALTYLHRSSTK